LYICLLPIRTVIGSRIEVFTFVINAKAGRGRAAKVRPTIERFMAAAGRPFQIVVTESPDQATRVASRSAAEGEVVVAVGGDGSIHHVFRGLVDAADNFGIDPKMGILPVGTGNDLARMLRLPGEWEAALTILTTEVARRIDFGSVTWEGVDDAGSRPFINVAGMGLDAQAGLLAVKLKPYIGNLCYTVSPVLSVWTYRRPHGTVTIDGGNGVAPVWRGKMLLTSIANGKWVGGGITISPAARIEDGMLDLCLVGDMSSFRVLRVLPKAIGGRHEGEREIVTHQFKEKVVVELEAPVPIHLDGEPCTRTARRAEFRVHAGSIRVVAPDPMR